MRAVSLVTTSMVNAWLAKWPIAPTRWRCSFSFSLLFVSLCLSHSFFDFVDCELMNYVQAGSRIWIANNNQTVFLNATWSISFHLVRNSFHILNCTFTPQKLNWEKTFHELFVLNTFWLLYLSVTLECTSIIFPCLESWAYCLFFFMHFDCCVCVEAEESHLPASSFQSLSSFCTLLSSAGKKAVKQLICANLIQLGSILSIDTESWLSFV